MKRLEKIIVPTDLSEHSRRALEYGAALAVEDKAALVIVHVANEFVAWELYDDAFGYSDHWPLDRAVMEAALDLTRFLEPHHDLLRKIPIVTKRIVLGVVHSQIIAVAEDEKADLIVLSPRRQRGWKSLLGRGISDKVTHLSPCPVLSVNPPLPSTQGRGKILPASFGWPRARTESV